MFEVLGWLFVSACLLILIICGVVDFWESIEKYIKRYRWLESRVHDHQKQLEIYLERLAELKQDSNYENNQKYQIFQNNCDYEAYQLTQAREDLADFWKNNRGELAIFACITCCGLACLCGLIHLILNCKGG